jgi:hypothetical protein
MPKEEFCHLMRTTPPIEVQDKDSRREAFRFGKVRIALSIVCNSQQHFHQSEKFVMRSQLDCHDSRLPGTGVFDIKTRAAVPLRLDLLNYEVGVLEPYSWTSYHVSETRKIQGI